MNFSHDPFCRGVLSDVSTFLELVRYLTHKDAELNNIFNLLDQATFRRVPGDYSDTENWGYADLVFLADVKSEFLPNKATPVQVCVGFLVEHKSIPDNGVLEQLRRYYNNLMVQKMKDNVRRGIPSIAIILYNGKENWNPLQSTFANWPHELQRLMLPFKCIMLDVDDVTDDELDSFSVRLAAFFAALKYVRDPEGHRSTFRRILDRIHKELSETEALDLLHQVDVYFGGWLKENFEEAFKMDFIRPNYKTVGDRFYENGLAEGEKIGREAGLADGRLEGEMRRAVETARKMLVKNRPMDEIVEFSGLSEEQIKTIQK